MQKESILSWYLFLLAVLFITIFSAFPYVSANAEQQFEEGMYKIGVDMDPGEYVLMADSGTTASFTISTDANQDKVKRFDLFDYDAIITVLSGEFLELDNCYAVLFDESETLDITGSGMFKIGTNLAPGEYKLLADEGKTGAYYIYPDSENWKTLHMDIFDTNTYVEVEDGQYLWLDNCYIENPIAPDENSAVDILENGLELRAKAVTDNSFNSDCIIDELGWVADVSETGKSLKTFYDMTGVQPYVYFKAYDDTLTSDSDKETYAENWYEENIDNETTFLYIYFAEEDSNEDIGYMYCVDGLEIASVMDDDAIDTFWKYVEEYWYSDLSTDDMLKQIFDSTAEAIITNSK